MANDILILHNGLRSEITNDTLLPSELGATTDTSQLFLGTSDSPNEIIFDPFLNAQSVVQTWLDSSENPQPGLTIDEGLVIHNVTDVAEVLSAMQESTTFEVGAYARSRRYVEVITEKSFNQLFADQHLTVVDHATGLRSSLFSKVLDETSGIFLSYDKNTCTTFFIDYSLKQTSSAATFVRIGSLRVINGVPQGIQQGKLSDENTEIWQDKGNNIPEHDEFSNISFDVAYAGNKMNITYTQDSGHETQISFTVKRWSM